MALQLDDPRVSEAHAMVSLRGDQLRLLALRRMFLVDGKPVGDAVLTPGLEIGLAPDLAIVVESVDLPDEVLALEADGMTRQILGGVCSVLVERGVPRLVSRSGAADTAQIWGTGEGWRVRLPGEASRDLAVGDAFTIAGKADESVRLCLGGPHDRAQIDSAFRVISEALASTPDKTSTYF